MARDTARGRELGVGHRNRLGLEQLHVNEWNACDSSLAGRVPILEQHDVRDDEPVQPEAEARVVKALGLQPLKPWLDQLVLNEHSEGIAAAGLNTREIAARQVSEAAPGVAQPHVCIHDKQKRLA